MSATASPPDAADLAPYPPLASTRTLTPASSSPVTTAPTNSSDVCLICLETLTPQPTPTSSTSSLSEPLLPVASDANVPRPTLVTIATQPPTATCGCKYRVHPACLQTWFAHQPVCPLCRTGVNRASSGSTRTPHAEHSPRTTRTMVIRWMDTGSPQHSETSAEENTDRETCTGCHKMMCILAGVLLAYVLISVVTVPNNMGPDVVNGTGSS